MKGLWNKLWNSSLVRFGLVGVLNTVVGTTIMFVLYNKLHCTYWQSSFANYFFFGSILSFFLNKYFTFRSKQRSWRRWSGLSSTSPCATCWLTASQAPDALAAGGPVQAVPGKRGHAGGHGALCGAELFGPAVFAFRKDPDQG